MDNSNKHIDELRKKYVISDEEIKIQREQKLLKMMYKCQDEMAELLDKKQKDPHYIMMEELIKRLENHLSYNNPII